MSNFKVGIIGTGSKDSGSIARRRGIPGIIAAGGKVSAVLTRFPENAKDLSNIGVKVFNCNPDFKGREEEIKKFFAEDFTIVYIAIPPKYMREYVKKAIKEEKTVVLEKPMGLNSYEAEMIKKLRDESNVNIMLSCVLIYHPFFYGTFLKNLLVSQKISQIKFCMKNGKIGLLKPWHLEANSGILLDLMPHIVSILGILDCISINEIECSDAKLKRCEEGSVVEAQIKLNEKNNGIKIDVDLSWISETCENYIELYFSDASKIKIDFSQTQWKIYLCDKLHETYPAEDLYKSLFNHISKGVCNPSDAKITIDIGILALKVVEQIYKKEIATILPHRGKAQLLSRIVKIKPGESATAEVDIFPNSFMLEGHFPNGKVVPAHYLAEMGNLTVGLALSVLAEKKNVFLGRFSIESKRMVRITDLVKTIRVTTQVGTEENQESLKRKTYLGQFSIADPNNSNIIYCEGQGSAII